MTSDAQGGPAGKAASKERRQRRRGGRERRPAGRRAEGKAEEAQEEARAEDPKVWAGGKSRVIEYGSHEQQLELFSVCVRRTK